jgi:hypothetical protein
MTHQEPHTRFQELPATVREKVLATKIPEFMDYLFSNVEGWPAAVRGFLGDLN